MAGDGWWKMLYMVEHKVKEVRKLTNHGSGFVFKSYKEVQTQQPTVRYCTCLCIYRMEFSGRQYAQIYTSTTIME